jgi:hypothetical protein
VLATNYDSWASLKTIEPRTLTLQPGESKDALITLTPNKNSQGTNSFKVQTIYNNLITEQEIPVDVASAPGFSFLTGSAIGNTISDNWFIWAIAALNVILVILIIVIVIRIARK